MIRLLAPSTISSRISRSREVSGVPEATAVSRALAGTSASGWTTRRPACTARTAPASSSAVARSGSAARSPSVRVADVQNRAGSSERTIMAGLRGHPRIARSSRRDSASLSMITTIAAGRSSKRPRNCRAVQTSIRQPESS